MNFGQGCPSLAKYVWAVEIETASFAVLARPQFAKLTKELIEDQAHGMDSTAEQELCTKGWPTFDKLLEIDADLLSRVIQQFLTMDLLDAILPLPITELQPPAYAIDSLEKLWIHGATVSLGGIAYPLQLNVRS